MTDKLILTDLANLQNDTTTIATINANNGRVVRAINNTLSRDGFFPNQMTNDLDMNSKRILNMHAPVLDTDAVRLGDVKDLIDNAASATPGISTATQTALNGKLDVSGFPAPALTNVANAILRDGYVTSKQVGANGNGSFDNVTAFADLGDAVLTGLCNKIVIAPGQYISSTAFTLPSRNLTLEGAGPYTTALFFPNDTNGVVYSGADAAYNLTVKNISAIKLGTTAGTGTAWKVSFPTDTGSSLKNCSFRGVTADVCTTIARWNVFNQGQTGGNPSWSRAFDFNNCSFLDVYDCVSRNCFVTQVGEGFVIRGATIDSVFSSCRWNYFSKGFLKYDGIIEGLRMSNCSSLACRHNVTFQNEYPDTDVLGAWSSSTSYVIGNRVTRLGIIYIATQNNLNSAPEGLVSWRAVNRTDGILAQITNNYFDSFRTDGGTGDLSGVKVIGFANVMLCNNFLDGSNDGDMIYFDPWSPGGTVSNNVIISVGGSGGNGLVLESGENMVNNNKFYGYANNIVVRGPDARYNLTHDNWADSGTAYAESGIYTTLSGTGAPSHNIAHNNYAKTDM